MIYYTYAYLREDRTPYYIGKGKGNRIYDKRKRIKPPKDKSRIIYLKKNLTEEQAFKHEIYMIDVFGRIDLGTGILHNRTDGGEGASGCIPSEETRRKMSDAKKGKLLSEEHKLKMREAHKNPSEEFRKKISYVTKGENNPMYGKKHSEETKQKISKMRKGKNTKPPTHTAEYEFISPEGKIMKGKNISEFARIYNLNVSALYDIKRGRRKQYNGWKLK
jgi:group I intron endonuclease